MLKSVILGSILVVAGLSGIALGSPASEDIAESEVFGRGEVLRLRLEIPSSGIDALRSNARGFVRATLKEGDRVYAGVGIRLKGSAGSFRPIDDQKPGFTVKLNEFIPEQRFHGLRKFLLNNSVQDPTYVSELIGYDLFRAAGVPAPRVAHARVELNGRALGLYVLVEGVTHDFLGRYFQASTGNLYEGPGEINGELDIDSATTPPDRADLKALAAAAQEADLGRRMEQFSKLLDMERFISFLAVEVLTWHWDGYAIGVNNFHVYHDPQSGRMVFLPHGADQLFQQPDAPVLPGMRGLVAQAVMQTPEGRRSFQGRLAALTMRLLDAESLRARVQAVGARIRPALAERDPGAAAAEEENLRGLLERIQRRRSLIEAQLNDPAGPFGKPLAFGKDGVARLSGWQPKVDRGTPVLRQGAEGVAAGKTLLQISAGAGDASVGSFRITVRLEPGRYRFEGRARLEGVTALEADPYGALSGIGLRISRGKPKTSLVGDADWTELRFEFQVEPQTAGPVQLVCEMRASRGQVWFDAESLKLVKL